MSSIRAVIHGTPTVAPRLSEMRSCYLQTWDCHPRLSNVVAFATLAPLHCATTWDCIPRLSNGVAFATGGFAMRATLRRPYPSIIRRRRPKLGQIDRAEPVDRLREALAQRDLRIP